MKTLTQNSSLQEIQAFLTEKLKNKKLKFGAELYVNPYHVDDKNNDENFQIYFEDASYDFDKIEEVLNIFRNIPNKYIFTRSLRSKSRQEMLKNLELILKNINVEDEFFAKTFKKDFVKFRESIIDAKNFLK